MLIFFGKDLPDVTDHMAMAEHHRLFDVKGADIPQTAPHPQMERSEGLGTVPIDMIGLAHLPKYLIPDYAIRKGLIF